MCVMSVYFQWVVLKLTASVQALLTNAGKQHFLIIFLWNLKTPDIINNNTGHFFAYSNNYSAATGNRR